MLKLKIYGLLISLVVVDAILLANANMLGKIGLFIHKYEFLKNFPRALVTISLMVGIAAGFVEVVLLLMRNERMKRAGVTILSFMTICTLAVAIYTSIMFFTKWTYTHTGLRFRLGALMLPVLLLAIFASGLLRIPGRRAAFPLSPMSDDMNETETSNSSE